MIKIEHFYIDGGGAIRCVYDDGREDWMLHPFRDDNCTAAHVLNDQRFLVVGQKSLRLYDSQQQTCVGSLALAENHLVVTAPNGRHFIVLDRLSGKHSSLTVYRASDLKTLAHIEDQHINSINPIYERHDGTIIIGAHSALFQGNGYVLTFDHETAAVEVVDSESYPYSTGKASWPDPTKQRLAIIAPSLWSEPVKGGTPCYGIAIEIWDLNGTGALKRFTLECLPLQLHANYRGQSQFPLGNPNRESWEDYVEAMRLASDKNFLSQSREELNEEARKRHSHANSVRHEFLRDNLVDMAWEADGQGLWALFAAGFLRRIGMDGSLSQRFVIEHFATPSALGGKRWPSPFSHTYARKLTCLADGNLRIDSNTHRSYGNSCVHFDPKELIAKRNRLQKFIPLNLFGASRDYIVRKKDEALESDAPTAPSLPSAFKIMPDTSDPRVTEPLPYDPERDVGLEERKRAFGRQVVEAEVPLLSLAPQDCISALEHLTQAIRTRFGELRCGAWFRPVFVLQPHGDHKPGLRLGEDDFCAHLVEQVPEAAHALEAVIHAFLDEAPNHEIPNSMLFTGLDEEYPALARIVEALVRLDPTRYAVLERYIRALYVEHDGYLKYSVAPIFGEVNGWRDVEAVRFGILWTLLQWCGGAGCYVCLWNDYGMSTEVQLRMPAEKFLSLFLREVQIHLNRTEEEQYPNSVVWNKNALADFLTACRSDLFAGPGDYNRKIRSGIDAFLGRKVT